MDQSFMIAMTDLPTAGGLTEDPSVLRRVEEFLRQESYLIKVNQILQEAGCVVQYRSLIDCLLAEILPRFKEPCIEFYEGTGKSLASLHPPETIEEIDAELGIALEVLVSNEWPCWADFVRDFKAEIKWEPL